jgi:hypothetical protein
MRSAIVVLVTAAALGVSACGATTRTSTVQTRAFPTLTSATATFVSLEHGKDANSELTVQLLRNNAELGAELRTVGTKFDDNSSSAPLTFSLSGPFTTQDLDTGQVRIRLTPDGNDDWTFDLRLTGRFSDGSTRDFLWRSVRLDRTNPERVLTFAGARL